ncbi:flagellar filament capping protein FliD [Spiribacter halobius]|uniref:Flagellar hook-associated protein 2 n=1 Tax=Sediminicurvatus halobius TaxID=2182432 RepID=A0A2U2MZK5_9GAMM|nr:flagellar filament capping protein FliD [Spiribacter halobius]PWG62300.1 flagellar hook protein [Spiribacter halobius]UEX79779.1 flagellar filament capping protein FliD [Spiribacter halobius]
MASISSLGVGSGLDIRSLVDQLVAAERAPRENRINSQQQRFETRLSALGQVKSALSDFRGTVRDLSSIDAFQKMKATSSDSDALSVSAESGAETGRYDIGVNRLADAQGAASSAFAARSSAVGSGTLTFRFGEVTTDGTGAVTGFAENTERGAVDIEIPGSANTVEDVRDAVNAAEIGVRASIVNDGSGERLVFSSSETGAANGFVVEAADDDGNNTDNAGLSRLAFNTAATNLEQTRAAQDAELTVDGLTITRASNTVDDLFEGVTLTLNGTTETAARVEISENRAAAKKQIQGFVDAYNGLQETLGKLTSYDAETDQAGPLNGDALVRSIQSGLRSTLGQTLGELEGTGLRSLADLGITTTRSGALEVDDARLDAALDENFDAVGALFAPTGLTGNADNVAYESSRSATQAGEYGVNVSALATRGTLTGGDISGSFPLEITDANDGLRFEIDGVQTAALNLTQGSYADGDALAAEIQSRINGDSNLRDAGISVSVAFNGTGLEITSSRYGSESAVELVSADAAGDFGLTVGDRAQGTDVQGTIGGREAEGFGRFLTGLEGPAEGLKLEITGEATGDRGSVIFSTGLMGELDRQISSFIDSDGTLSSSTESLNNRLEGLADDRQRLEDRMDRIERRYTEQFSAMDALVAELNQTSTFLSQQLSGLPGAGGSGGGGGLG